MFHKIRSKLSKFTINKHCSLNKALGLFVCFRLVLQLLYAVIDAAVVSRDNGFGVGVGDIPILSWVLLLLSPLLVVTSHELVKHFEIK